MIREDSKVQTFDTGATRSPEGDKLDYEGFLSPVVLERYAKYLHKHRLQTDGKLRASDNWQKGIPKFSYMKSGFRHFMEVWKLHRAGGGCSREEREEFEDSLCALIFNFMGYLFEVLKEK